MIEGERKGQEYEECIGIIVSGKMSAVWDYIAARRKRDLRSLPKQTPCSDGTVL